MGRPKAIADRGAEKAVPVLGLLSSQPQERVQSFALSLVLHVGLVTLLVNVDLPRGPRTFDPATAPRIVADQSYQITLYTPKTDLPAVAPLEEKGRDGADRARERFRQKIVADDPNPQSTRQKIVGPAPDIEIEQDIRSPNLLAWNAPKVGRPRFQMDQQRATTPERQALSAAAAPQIEARPQAAPSFPKAAGPRLRFQQETKVEPAPARQALAPQQAPELQAAGRKVDLAGLDQQPRLRYWTPEAGTRTTPERKAIRGETAPQIGAGQEALDLGDLQSAPRLRYWTSGNNPEAPGRKAVAIGDAPAIDAKTTGTAQLGSLTQQPRMRYRNWSDQPAAPKRGVLTAGQAAPTIANADGLGGDGAGGGVTGLLARHSLADAVKNPEFGAGHRGGLVAPAGSGPGGPVVGPGNDGPNALVIGLDPDPNAVAAIPLGSRRGRFSASPDGGPGGGDLKIGSGNGASLRASNLAIDGGALQQPGPLVQRNRAGSSGLLRPGSRASADSSALSVLQRRSSVRNIGAPPVIDPEQAPVKSKRADVLFLDREVFVLAVNTPNVTSHSGSWVIRFAERQLNGRPLTRKKRLDEERYGKGDDSEPEDTSQGKLSAPAPRLKVDPKYIRTAADEGVEGTVTLYAVIQRNGKVRDIEVVEPLDDRLDESAMAALSQWEFHPATRLGVPVEVDVLIDIPFRLAPPPERVIQRF